MTTLIPARLHASLRCMLLAAASVVPGVRHRFHCWAGRFAAALPALVGHASHSLGVSLLLKYVGGALLDCVRSEQERKHVGHNARQLQSCLHIVASLLLQRKAHCPDKAIRTMHRPAVESAMSQPLMLPSMHICTCTWPQGPTGTRAVLVQCMGALYT